MHLFHKHGRHCGHDADAAQDDGRRHARGGFWGGPRHGGPGRGDLGGPGLGASGRGGHGGGGRLGRLFAHGDLHLVILHLIAEKPRHGYEIIKAIEEMTGGVYTPSPGTIYPALTMLEEQGQVSQSAEGSKKLYDLTADGRAYLDANRQAVDTLVARIRHVCTAHGAGPSPRIVRAVENLRLALHLRLDGGPLTDEQVQAIVTALDQATIVIEGV